uniref:NADH-ubiquinone oxidoreductase chain 2 n=1 Tax=Scolytus schevyrewi TaxID=1158787 RepID=A0A6G6C8W5_9CUCU|nr:NADH dehydrogenase subunit 2 [Scolytus schevyrewi]QID77580.1 NADH dehydrogenase subunit 2 [Scolytus schevyrewi]
MYTHKMGFLILLISGTMMTISSPSWFSAWIGLEVNLLSFIPLIKNKDNTLSSESMIKYFITQALGSMIVIFSIITMHISPNVSMMLNMGLFLKLGAAPLHSWFPEVMAGLDWTSALLLMTWQKIAPMVLIMYSTGDKYITSVFIIASSMMGGLLGLNQTNLRKILAYSSINHIGWMLAALTNSWTVWTTYFLAYSLINMTIIYILKNFKMSSINQMIKMKSSPMISSMTTMNILSLGGLPPFLGFLPKWLTITLMTHNNLPFLTIPLIVFTLMSLFYYLRMTFNCLMMITESSVMSTKPKMNFILMVNNFILLSSLLMTPVLILIF